MSRLTFDPVLPISEWVPEIVSALAEHQVLVVAGETGSGKTTQLPKMCLAAGRRRIAHTQPRRIAARTVAQRIAEEMDVELGSEVGYQVRFSKRATKDTSVTVMTDGVLLNAIGQDRLLRRWDTIIIDEAHERSLNIDYLLGYLKQLLPKRPDLKVIITSATIDTQRFAEHFDDAPVVEVSGRTFPVEVRYRPIDVDGGEADQLEAIGSAVDELWTEGNGDILVFLSGEREIRDAADHLTARNLPRTEVLPLYSRLSAAEQQKIFTQHPGRRIVLSTNVAETSLTVPGIRYVVDVGTARISRWSARTKVQRLPIEPISQASANQRSGRCGRVAPGIAIRLYSEEDFESRPEFTEPEILRTNLASVILQMAEARLGSIDDFPFVEAPDRAQINDGLRLLEELGALSSGRSDVPRLTKVGRSLARVPLDPRLARMLVEAERRSCLNEVLVIVAGLAIQDPRERPEEKREAADAAHRRFWTDDPEQPGPGDSDFLAWWRLWQYLRRQQKNLSGNAFRRLCREEFLHFVRIREWQDLHTQLRQIAEEQGWRHNDQPASPDDIHTALLAGLLSHIGLVEERPERPSGRKRVRLGPREYLGTRGARFALNRGSALARKPPELVMAHELVETNRLWARTVAPINEAWVEDVGAHLLKRQYSEPLWSSRRGAAMARERVSLWGVPIVADRLVQYSRIDPEAAREIFIRSALVEGDWHTRHHFFARNQEVREHAEEMEQRTRRRDIVSDDAIFAFYDARIPADVVSATHFDTWWKSKRREDDAWLDLALVDVASEAADSFDTDEFPDEWVVGAHQLPVDYSFSPGEDTDGLTVEIPLAVLNQVHPETFSWQVPGLRAELATELIRSLPKQLRTQLVPAPDTAARAMEWLDADAARRRPDFADALAAAILAVKGVQVPRGAWDRSRLPAHLRIRFEVRDGDATVAEGEDLGTLQCDLRKEVSASLTAAASDHRHTGATEWSFGEIPTQVSVGSAAAPLEGYPALVDEGTTVGVQVFDTPGRADASHRGGLRRLLSLRNPDPTTWVIAHLTMADKLALGTSPYPNVPALLADARLASLEDLAARSAALSSVRTSADFESIRQEIRGDHPLHMSRLVSTAAEILRRHAEVVAAVKGLPRGDTHRDITEQLDNLVFDGFLSATGEPHRSMVPKYLSAALKRIELARTNPAREATQADVMAELEDEYAHLCAAQPEGPLPQVVEDVGWALEELRVSLFAQQLGTRMPVSAKRVRRMMKDAR